MISFDEGHEFGGWIADVIRGSVRTQLAGEADRRRRELRLCKIRRVQQASFDWMEHGNEDREPSHGAEAGCAEGW